MFVRINQLYINTESIDTLGIFELPTEKAYEIGIMVNNQRYCIYSYSGYVPAEMIKELQFNVIGILEQIVECARVEQKQIVVPKVDLSKYIENVEKEITKEQIND